MFISKKIELLGGEMEEEEDMEQLAEVVEEKEEGVEVLFNSDEKPKDVHFADIDNAKQTKSKTKRQWRKSKML